MQRPETGGVKIVKDYNYVPYASVKTTSEAKKFFLGILFRSIFKTNLFLNGVIPAAQAQGYSIMIYDSCNDPVHELKNIASLCKNNVDSIIWEPVQEESLEHRHYFEEQNIEVCLMNSKDRQSSYFIDFAGIGYHHRKPGCPIKKTAFVPILY